MHVYQYLVYKNLIRGTPLERVRKNIREIAKNKRLSVHGGNDLSSLQILPKDIRENNIEVLDTPKLFLDEESRSTGLEIHDKFWYKRQKLQKNNWAHPINGHPLERDSRLTILSIHKLLLDMEKGLLGLIYEERKNDSYGSDQWKNSILN